MATECILELTDPPATNCEKNTSGQSKEEPKGFDIPLDDDFTGAQVPISKALAARHVLELTDPLTMNLLALQAKEEPEVTPTRTDTPPAGDEEHTLTAFGDISLSTIDFVPGPPSALAPIRRIKPKPLEPKIGDIDRRSIPLVIRKVLPPAPSKASVRKPEASFEMMVLNLKKLREEGRSKSDVASSGIAASRIEVYAPQSRRLIDMKNFGTDAAKAKTNSHDVVENSAHTKAIDARRCLTVIKDENRDGASPAVVTPKPKKNALRGNAKLPKRPPIPRWDDDNNSGVTGSEAQAAGYHLGLTSSPFQVT
ncbi:hypothetical protein GALMADRAFT_156550 [Galerina marginata CBS 339.88]|uniref:Uncharacterized protein n=1 Tax=Galerina marginata (strain CBS 339.88) TaxID=685588 RepID=A0A067T6L2_GALM3|nr:hypothetical protein GALMADRAFT_156550 [Galerina marginata CBS 339.88]